MKQTYSQNLGLRREVKEQSREEKRILMAQTSEPLIEEQPQTPEGRTTTSWSSTTSVHVTALDGLVNVNSLFTIAVFVGMSFTAPNQHSLENSSSCIAGVDVAKTLLVLEVVSFSCFLFSSLISQALKLAINLLNSKKVDEAFEAHISVRVLRFGMLISAVGSLMGCLFLTLSMVKVIEIRLGMLSCEGIYSVAAVTVLCILVLIGLATYLGTAIYAFLQRVSAYVSLGF